MAIPLFKTHFSIGKSIIKPDEAFSLCKEAGLDTAVFVEDSFSSFRKIISLSEKTKTKVIFGIRVPIVQSSETENPSKLVFFAKNSDGVKYCKKIYSDFAYSDFGAFKLSNFDKKQSKNVKIGVPFYDSYIFNNIFHFGMSSVALDGLDHFYMEEDNSHPFDPQIKNAIGKINTVKTKTIYYKNRDDFAAFQFYKSVCNRQNGGKSPSFSAPNVEHLCSPEFCFESFLENEK